MIGDQQITEQGRRKNPLATMDQPVYKLVLLMLGEERPGIPPKSLPPTDVIDNVYS
jgi:hypothetical protein